MLASIPIPDLELESALWQQGYVHVAGVDEAGRGPLAGPVSAGAVIIHSANQMVAGVRDSKYMTAAEREAAYLQIIKQASSWGVALVDAARIDAIGINQAVKLAMELALQQLEQRLQQKLSFVIVDGIRTLPLSSYKSTKILHGGLYHYSIAAGSILAKVTRDHLMQEYDHQYPHYGFCQHKGYGTASHLQALKKFGPCPLHRLSYAPVASVVSSFQQPL